MKRYEYKFFTTSDIDELNKFAVQGFKVHSAVRSGVTGMGWTMLLERELPVENTARK